MLSWTEPRCWFGCHESFRRSVAASDSRLPVEVVVAKPGMWTQTHQTTAFAHRPAEVSLPIVMSEPQRRPSSKGSSQPSFSQPVGKAARKNSASLKHLTEQQMRDLRQIFVSAQPRPSRRTLEHSPRAARLSTRAHIIACHPMQHRRSWSDLRTVCRTGWTCRVMVRSQWRRCLLR